MGASYAKIALPEVKAHENYTAIITGGHIGLGYEVAKYLTHLGARVIITTDSHVKGRAAVLRIKADLMEMAVGSVEGGEKNGVAENTSLISRLVEEPKIEYMILEHRHLQSVVDFAEAFKAKDYPLHLLMCNTAIVEQPYEVTENSFESHFQVNYLSHFLLTLHLLPLLRKESDARIINVTSAAHNDGELNMKNMQGRGGYDKSKFYANSTLYQVMFMFSLMRRLVGSKVSVFSVHGGSAEEEIKKNEEQLGAWSTTYNVSRSIGSVLATLNSAISTCLAIALTPALRELKGSYFVNGLPVATSNKSRKPKSQEVLWSYSLDCVKSHIDDDLASSVKLDEDVLKEILGIGTD